MSNEKTKILYIIPAYNEEESIVKTCKSIIRHNQENGTNYDFIVVNDGSIDNTKKVCEENKLPVINLKINSGIGSAVQTGYKYAKQMNYDIAIQFDGDGQHNVEHAYKLINPIIENQANMVIGSRFIEKNSSDFKSSSSRRAGIKLISFFIKLFTGKKIYDTTSGFRAADKNVISIFSNTYPYEYPEPVSSVDIIKRKLKIKEVPVSMNERQAGTSSINKWKNVYFMVNVIFSIAIEALGGYKYEY